ncbi:unnamed protein product [Vitrella brassicaformis CCMP3155]|uniref:Uncharacterized protein n=2 Tax=Vitrella brassicaformis TaxID=1169539 RepID=A0A0G4FG03_VITBC|nr:unnamed protein product [Vitrella brassicaformis CCMP3155]|eukprot:CEM12121.1 unnamed protein product [Vitrella brassicaformis CCMP3155]
MSTEEGERLREIREHVRRHREPLIAKWRAEIEALAVEAAAIQRRALLSDQAALIAELVGMRAKVEALKRVEQLTAADREELLADIAAMRQQETPDAAAMRPGERPPRERPPPQASPGRPAGHVHGGQQHQGGTGGAGQ